MPPASGGMACAAPMAMQRVAVVRDQLHVIPVVVLGHDLGHVPEVDGLPLWRVQVSTVDPRAVWQLVDFKPNFSGRSPQLAGLHCGKTERGVSAW
ncbi:hypothetical protein I5U65_09895 [Stenotrophomonas maltophilia]|nr:hypothetical protein [Stenotrophomonas maltophilia]